MIERLDIVDPSGQLIGSDDRDAVHRGGHWHQVFHCLLVRLGPPSRVLLQRRLGAAASFPGLLDITAAGHLAAGESPLDGVREIREELGIDVDPERSCRSDDGCSSTTEVKVSTGRSPTSTCWPTSARCRAFESRPSATSTGWSSWRPTIWWRSPAIDQATAACTELHADGTVTVGTCRASDLVPALDGYWIVLAVMADRFARGERPLAI